VKPGRSNRESLEGVEEAIAFRCPSIDIYEIRLTQLKSDRERDDAVVAETRV
jgi:hypothetical protein